MKEFRTSCRSMRNEHDWTLDPPLSVTQAWNQMIPLVTFSNTPLIEATQILQGQVRGVNIAVAPSLEERETAYTRITFTANNLRLYETLHIIAEAADLGILYRDNQAVFAPKSHGDGCIVPIRIGGRCMDNDTEQPIKRIEIERIKYMGMPNRRLANAKLPVSTDMAGNFDISIPVFGYDISYRIGEHSAGTLYPYDQVLVLSITAEGYIPQTHEIPIVSNQKEYGIDVRLKRDSSNTNLNPISGSSIKLPEKG